MSNYIEQIKEYFKEKKLRFFVNESGNGKSLFIPMELKNVTAMNIILDVADSGKCNAYSTIVTKVEQNIQEQLFHKLNEANNNFSFASFSFDKDDDLMASVNFYLNTHEPGKMVMEYIMTFFCILDDVAPTFLEAIWALRKEPRPEIHDEDEYDEPDDFDDFDEYDGYDFFDDETPSSFTEEELEAMKFVSENGEMFEELFKKKKPA